MNRDLIVFRLVCAVALGARLLPAGAHPSSPVQSENWLDASSLALLPADLQQVLGVEGISDRGGAFNPSCVARAGVRSRRFVFGALDSARAVVAVERGGRGHYVETLEFGKVAGFWRLERRGSGNVHIRSSGELVQAHNQSARPVRQAATGGIRQPSSRAGQDQE